MLPLLKIFNLLDTHSFNHSYITGALDIIVVKHPDTTLHGSPFFVRFATDYFTNLGGKLVDIEVNGHKVQVKMMLNDDGSAFFPDIQRQGTTYAEMSQPVPYKQTGKPVAILERTMEFVEQEDEEGLKDVEMSICALDEKLDNQEIMVRFNWNKVTYEEFQGNPYQVLYHHDFCLRIYQEIYDFWTGIPTLLSILAFNKLPGNSPQTHEFRDRYPLIELSLCKDLIQNTDNKAGVFEEHKINIDDSVESIAAILANEQLMVKLENHLFDLRTVLPHILSLLIYQRPLTSDKNDEAGFSSYGEIVVGNNNPNSLRLESRQLGNLLLKPGSNEIKFIVNYSQCGRPKRQQAVANIFLWEYNDKIIVSDIDGTVTKSDIPGQILPVFKIDWTHQGIVKLYNRLQALGYQILYLSSRAIGQISYTKNYLRRVNQNDQSLPLGPVILAPTQFYESFMNELIYRTPQRQKAVILEGIKTLFPNNVNPYAGGFGNRETDALAYAAAEINVSRIFIINPKGELKQRDDDQMNSTYSDFADIADQFFPNRHIRKLSEELLYQEMNSPPIPIKSFPRPSFQPFLQKILQNPLINLLPLLQIFIRYCQRIIPRPSTFQFNPVHTELLHVQYRAILPLLHQLYNCRPVICILLHS